MSHSSLRRRSKKYVHFSIVAIFLFCSFQKLKMSRAVCLTSIYKDTHSNAFNFLWIPHNVPQEHFSLINSSFQEKLVVFLFVCFLVFKGKIQYYIHYLKRKVICIACAEIPFVLLKIMKNSFTHKCSKNKPYGHISRFILSALYFTQNATLLCPLKGQREIYICFHFQ